MPEILTLLADIKAGNFPEDTFDDVPLYALDNPLAITFPWSQIAWEEFPYQFALSQYSAPERAYHNVNHLVKIYGWLDAWDIPYIKELDQAVAWHDLIIRPREKAEVLSMRAFEIHARGSFFERINTHLFIHSTINHSPKHTHALMAMADLGDFLDTKTSLDNLNLLFKEAQLFSSIDSCQSQFDQKKWIEETVSYLTQLQSRIITDLSDQRALSLSEKEFAIWEQIAMGIDDPIAELLA